jgi:hypothetical protein
VFIYQPITRERKEWMRDGKEQSIQCYLNGADLENPFYGHVDT